MRKLFLLMVATMSYVCTNAQQTIDSYYTSYFGKEKSIQASKNSNGIYNVWIDVAGEYDKDDVSIGIEGEDIPAFINALHQIKQKYAEWDNVAKQNNVKKISKDFEITFPRVTVAWYGSKWFFAFKHILSPRFMVLESTGSSYIVFSDKVQASSNEYIDQKYYLVFSSVNEVNDLISKISPDSIKAKMEQKNSQADLFK